MSLLFGIRVSLLPVDDRGGPERLLMGACALIEAEPVIVVIAQIRWHPSSSRILCGVKAMDYQAGLRGVIPRPSVREELAQKLRV